MKTKSLLYTVLVFILVGLFACDNKDEPKTPAVTKLDRNAMVRVRAQDKPQLKTTNPGEMNYEDSVKFITRWAWRWEITREDGWPGGWGIGTDARDTVNHKLLWWGEDVLRPTGIDPVTKDTLFKLGKIITEYSNLVVIMGIYDDGSPWQWDADQPDFSGKFPTSEEIDTVAYIPNSVMKAAREKIQVAFEQKDFKRVYELFDSAYVFIPITGERYRALMEKGEK